MHHCNLAQLQKVELLIKLVTLYNKVLFVNMS